MMSLTEFATKIEKSKSYDVKSLFLSAIPPELYLNNSMSIPASAERNLYDACMGKFASEKDESDYYSLMELIRLNKPIYPLNPVIRSKDVVGITLTDGQSEWTLNISELKAFAAEEVFGEIITPSIRINSKAENCMKGVFTYCKRGGKIISIYRQSSGIQIIPAVSASYINIIDDGMAWKVRINGTLTIPALKIPDKYQRFIR